MKTSSPHVDFLIDTAIVNLPAVNYIEIIEIISGFETAVHIMDTKTMLYSQPLNLTIFHPIFHPNPNVFLEE